MDLLFKRIPYVLLFLSLSHLDAQAVLTPSPDHTGSPFGGEWGPYNVTNSFEAGYRFTRVGGDANLFRSVENYGNGIRLFGNSFTANSRDGHGVLFDTLSLTTSGLGNDPYGVATLRLEKNDRYRYDMQWRRNDYFNASLLDGESTTLKNTVRVMQDHDLTIQAAKWAKLLLGYTRNHETGPEFTDYETYIGGLARSVLPLDRNARRDYNEYRLGTELDFLGFRLLLSHRWEYYKDDSSIASLVPGQTYALDYLRTQPYNPSLEITYPQAATAYLRSQPMHTQNLAWFANLARKEKYWAVDSRVSYSKGDSQTLYFESESGASQASALVPTGDGRLLVGNNSGFGRPATAVTYMPGTARHPFTAGDFIFSFFPTSRLTIVNSTSAQSNRYDGTGNEFRTVGTGVANINRFWSFQLNNERISNAFDLNYKVNNWLGLNSEYRYTARMIDNNTIRTGTTNSRDINSFHDHLNEGTLGFRLKPMKQLTFNADASLGRDNGAYTPTSPAHFHNIRARLDYRAKKVQFGLTYRQLYNLNAPLSVASSSTGQLLVGAQLDYYASHLRDFSAHTSFEANRRMGFDLSYSKTHLDTLANLWAELVPAKSTTITSVSVRGYTSQYVSNLHTVSLLARTTFKRGTLYAGYNISHDTGDGRNLQSLGITDLAAAYTARANTFPLTYQAPLARLSIKLSPKLQWNGGWELYRYGQQFAYFGYQPYYRAHTGYTSLSFTF